MKAEMNISKNQWRSTGGEWLRKNFVMKVNFNNYLCPRYVHTPYGNYDYSSLANVYLMNKTRLSNGNCLITDLITEMGVAHALGLSVLIILIGLHIFEVPIGVKSKENK